MSPLGLYAVSWLEEMRRALVVDNRDHRPVYCSRHQRGFQVGRRAAVFLEDGLPFISRLKAIDARRGAACGLPLNLLSVAAWRWWGCVRLAPYVRRALTQVRMSGQSRGA